MIQLRKLLIVEFAIYFVKRIFNFYYQNVFLRRRYSTAIFIGLITILITDDRISCNITLFHVTLYNFHLITGMERRKHEMERLGLWRCTRPQNTAESAVETRRSYV